MNIQVSAKHKIIGLPYRADVAGIFPHGKHLDGYLLLPHGPDETAVLRNLGFDVPAPVLVQYDWVRGTPFEVQRKTVAMLTLNQRAYVLNGMGTGKTKAALWAADYLQGNKQMGRVLIVAPLSTLTFVWAKEIFDTIPHRSSAVLHGSRAKRLDLLARPHDFYIINHDGLAIIIDELSRRPDIDTLIIDELAVFRNGQTDRTKLLRALATTKKWVWGLTGAPTPNEPTDVWAQVKIITPDRAPKYFTHFRDMLMTRVSQYKWKPKSDATERAFSVMQPAVRYTLDDVTELPDVIERIVPVAMGDKQEAIYKTMKAQAVAMVALQLITAANAGAVMSKLLQISTGWVYDSKQKVVKLDNNERLEALLDVINATERKVLVFVPFRHALFGISDFLAVKKVSQAVVHGGVPQGTRSTIFSTFQMTSKYKCIVAHPNTMAHGLTLTEADTVVWFGPITSLEIFDQANARIRRIGQKHKQQILMFAGSPVERHVYNMLRNKQSIQDKLLELFANETEAQET